MIPVTEIGPILLTTVTGATLLLFVWIRSLTHTRTKLHESEFCNAQSVTAKTLIELSEDPPNFRSMIDVLRDNVIRTAAGTGEKFLAEIERQQPLSYVDAQTFKSIYLSYLWSMKLMVKGKKK